MTHAGISFSSKYCGWSQCPPASTVVAALVAVVLASMLSPVVLAMQECIATNDVGQCSCAYPLVTNCALYEVARNRLVQTLLVVPYGLDLSIVILSVCVGMAVAKVFDRLFTLLQFAVVAIIVVLFMSKVVSGMKFSLVKFERGTTARQMSTRIQTTSSANVEDENEDESQYNG